MVSKTILVTGSNGFIGSLLVHHLLQNSTHKVIGVSLGNCRTPSHSNFNYWNVDITNPAQVKKVFNTHKPQVVVHCAAISQVDICEENPDLCTDVNVNATRYLVLEVSKLNAHFIFLSSDFVFDGTKKWVTPETKPNPISVYGKSKLEAEKVVVSEVANWAIIRPVLVYGYSSSASRGNIFTWVLESLKNGKSINVVQDQLRTPTFVLDVVKLIERVSESNANGYYNIGGSEVISVLDFSIQIGRIAGLDVTKIHPIKSNNLNGANLRPKYSCFSNSGAKNKLDLVSSNIYSLQIGTRKIGINNFEFIG